MMRRTTIETPLGAMLFAAGDAGLTGAWFVGQKYFPGAAETWREVPDDPLFLRARRQLDAYFAGTLTVFDLPLDLRGTPFQRRVWEALREIPFGGTRTYGALADGLGMPTGARAVGTAVGHNPVSVIVPCHRVLGTNGSLTGYAGGLERKRGLLEREGVLAGGRGEASSLSAGQRLEEPAYANRSLGLSIVGTHCEPARRSGRARSRVVARLSNSYRRASVQLRTSCRAPCVHLETVTTPGTPWLRRCEMRRRPQPRWSMKSAH